MIRLIALTDAGRALAERLQAGLDDAEVWFKPQPFADRVQGAFKQGDRLIMICATGIAVRTLAAVLADKRSDPPVLVLDEAGRFVIPLLSGHEGGANDWGRDIAGRLGAQLVLTTAKPYLQPVYTVGLGCERHCPTEALAGLLQQCLDRLDLDIARVHSLNSIDIKADEVGLLTLAAELGKPYRTWSAHDLNSVDHLLQTPSDYVFDTVGVRGVAEAAALYAAGREAGTPAELVLAKQKNSQATCAVARAYPIDQRSRDA